jgi:hypothetical protein
MRTTVTLELDVAALVEKDMRERGVTFKQALNEAVRAGLAPPRPSAEYRVRARSMGRPLVSLTRALALASDLEDDEIVRKLAQGK